MAYDRCESLQGSSSRRRSKGRQSGYEPYKRGLNTRIHLAVDSSGMPVRAIITEGTRADCREAIHLIEGIDAQNLLADRGYDTSEIVGFQRLSEQATDERDHLAIIAVLERLVQRHIVFVDQKNCFLAVVFIRLRLHEPSDIMTLSQ